MSRSPAVPLEPEAEQHIPPGHLGVLDGAVLGLEFGEEQRVVRSRQHEVGKAGIGHLDDAGPDLGSPGFEDAIGDVVNRPSPIGGLTHDPVA